MAQRLWRDAHRFAVSADNGAVHREFRDAEFLDQDLVCRDDDYNRFRSLAGSGSEFEQHGADDARHLLESERDDRLYFEDIRSDGV